MNIQHPDGVVEWYENSAKGIEHGFILGTRTTDTGTRDIRVFMDGMVPSQSGNDLIWSLRNGANALAYSGLQVKDATGARIEAQMQAAGDSLVIQLQDSHAVYPVYVDPLITRVTAKLVPINLGDGNAGDYFGNAISTDGQTLVVGAMQDNEARGSVYIFTRSAGEWIFKSKLNPSDTASRSKFGTSVAFQGNILVVGSPGDGYSSAGYIYEKAAGEWTLSAKVSPPPGLEGVSIGCSVAVDDGVVMVGADGYTGGSPAVIGKGYVYVFEKVAGVWTLQLRLEDPAGTTNDEYGAAIAIKSGYAYIGKPGKKAGEVMIYKKGGSSWTYVTRVYGVSKGDRFGESLATDGSALAVGAPFDNTAVGADAGSVTVFRKSAEVWTSEATLTATDAVSHDYFGSSVAIQGNRLLIGALLGYNSYGCAYIFEKTTKWSQKTRLIPYNTSPDGRSGHCVALVGNTVLVGAYQSDTYAHWYAGIVNEYRLKSGVWKNTDLITAGDSGFYMNFGSALDMDGQRIVVGVPRDSSPYGESTGSVYVFLKINGEWQIETVLMDDSPTTVEYFGSAVDIEGGCLMVGNPQDVKMSATPGDGTLYRYGSVTCFRKGAKGWAAEAKMRPKISSASDNDRFGSSISLRGNTILIGAPVYSTTPFNSPGAGFLFSKVNGTWVQQARLIVAGSTSYWKVGASVALGDGQLFLSAPGHSDASYHYGRVFEFTGSGTKWKAGSGIGPSVWEGYGTFGSSIALDGDSLLVGSWADNAGAGQKARVFRRSGSTWQEEAALVSPDAGDTRSHTFGAYVALKGDLALVSDTSDYMLGQPLAGSVHVFRKQGGTWSRTQKLIAPDASSYAYFGTPIVTDGISVLTAATNETIANPLTGDITDYRGSVYLFELGEAYRTLEVIGQDNFSGQSALLPRTGHLLSFPWTVVGGSNLSEQLILRNNGVIPISGISIAIEGKDASQFRLAHPYSDSIPTTLATSLAPGAEVNVYLYFSPIVSGVNKSASLRITSDDGAGDYQIGISGLANTKPQNTGGTYICFAGQPIVIFAKDLAMDPDGHSFVLNSGSTPSPGGTMTASGNKLTFVPNAGFTGNIVFWYYITDEYGAYNQIVNTMTVVAAPAAGDAFAAAQPIKRLDANSLEVLLKGESGVSYQIQRSYDLQAWETLGSAAPVSSGDLRFMDYQNASPNAYYRLLK
ncbi:MAG: Ig-like domain-containing protein [Luteolibacter sp.]|uniref:Ig-like domain-containing protein n=1 Tax=Luteolibacter sp. TaxID=1962973 RepID=UPI00326496AE